MAEIMRATGRLQKAIASGKLTDKENVMNWILSQVILTRDTPIDKICGKYF